MPLGGSTKLALVFLITLSFLTAAAPGGAASNHVSCSSVTTSTLTSSTGTVYVTPPHTTYVETNGVPGLQKVPCKHGGTTVDPDMNAKSPNILGLCIFAGVVATCV